MDPFRVLGVQREADTGEIRVAYRQRARRAHPDAGGSDVAFFHLTEAYRIALKQRSSKRGGGSHSGATTGSGNGDEQRPGGTKAKEAEDWTAAADLRRQFHVWWQVRAWQRAARGPLVMMLCIQVVLLTVIALSQPSSPLPAVLGALMTGLVAGAVATVNAAKRAGLL